MFSSNKNNEKEEKKQSKDKESKDKDNKDDEGEDTMYDQVMSVVDQMNEEIGKLGSYVKDSKAVQKAVAAYEAEVDELKDASASDVAQMSYDRLNKLKDKVISAAKEASSGSFVSEAEKRIGKLSTKATEAFEKLKESAEELAEEAQEKAETVKEKVKEKASKAKDMAKDKAMKAKDVAVDTLHEAKEKVHLGFIPDSVFNFALLVLAALGAYYVFTSWIYPPRHSGYTSKGMNMAEDGVYEMLSEIKKASDGAWDKAMSQYKDFGGSSKKWVKGTSDDAQKAVVEALKQLQETVTQQTQQSKGFSLSGSALSAIKTIRDHL